MNNRSHELKNYLVPGAHVHLVGIGGVSMRPLGLVLKGMGMYVTGSDMNSSVSTDELIAKGIAVAIGHRAENVHGAVCVIRTAAAHNDNPEIAECRNQGIPVFERAEAWGVIMRSYKNAVCVSGTHGKTTTTSMVTHILMDAAWDPTVMIGGELPLLKAGHRVGQGDTIVLESCEYCDSFLNFFPTLAVVLNVEADHLDYFKDLKDVQKSFRAFAGMATDGVLANGDDLHTAQALRGLEYVSFGFGKKNRVKGVNVSPDWRHFDVECDGEKYCHVDLTVLGKHNAMNALAAAGTAWMLGIDGEHASRGLHAFSGARRRMEYKGMFNGAHVYDDYAHHPIEIAATLKAVKESIQGKIVAVFQPHRYTRFRDLWDEFLTCFDSADEVYVMDVYGAGESLIAGVTAPSFAEVLNAKGKKVFYMPTIESVKTIVHNLTKEDAIVCLGAGSISSEITQLLKKEKGLKK